MAAGRLRKKMMRLRTGSRLRGQEAVMRTIELVFATNKSRVMMSSTMCSGRHWRSWVWEGVNSAGETNQISEEEEEEEEEKVEEVVFGSSAAIRREAAAEQKRTISWGGGREGGGGGEVGRGWLRRRRRRRRKREEGGIYV